LASPRFIGPLLLLLAGGACWFAPEASVDALAVRAPLPSSSSTFGATEQDAGGETETASDGASSLDTSLLDPWSLAAREDGDACRAELKASGYRFQAAPEKSQPDKSGCGMPHAVMVIRGPTGILYDPPITVDCSLARALGSVEKIVQEEADTHLQQKIVKIGNVGGYACRPRNFRKGASLSAHAFGTALDLTSFQPMRGATTVIDRDFDEQPRSTEAQDARRRFLRGVFSRLRRHEADLTYVVGPGFNANHHNHFHLDRGGWKFWIDR
jgi:hypothetical protein